MHVLMTYYIEYDNGKSAWLSPDKSPSDFPDVTYTEERPMLYAEDGMTLQLKETGEIVGEAIWLKDTTQDDYEEIAQA